MYNPMFVLFENNLVPLSSISDVLEWSKFKCDPDKAKVAKEKGEKYVVVFVSGHSLSFGPADYYKITAQEVYLYEGEKYISVFSHEDVNKHAKTWALVEICTDVLSPEQKNIIVMELKKICAQAWEASSEDFRNSLS
jgi:hypothetical protein